MESTCFSFRIISSNEPAHCGRLARMFRPASSTARSLATAVAHLMISCTSFSMLLPALLAETKHWNPGKSASGAGQFLSKGLLILGEFGDAFLGVEFNGNADGGAKQNAVGSLFKGQFVIGLDPESAPQLGWASASNRLRRGRFDESGRRGPQSTPPVNERCPLPAFSLAKACASACMPNMEGTWRIQELSPLQYSIVSPFRGTQNC